MIWAARQLLVPCNYLRISHGTGLFKSKAVFDWVLPICLTAATCVVCLWLAIPLAVPGHVGLAKHLLDLLALMVVFYMAALAAVATFDRGGIDESFKGTKALLMVRDHRRGGARVPKDLTYRQFVSYLFGYLSFLSLILYVFMIFLMAGWSRLEKKILATTIIDKHVFTFVVDPVLFIIVFFGIWQLIFTSLLGIYFLTERIQSIRDPHN